MLILQMALHRHLYALGAMPIDTISYAIVALLRLIILSLWLIRLLALQLSLTLASFCAPDESRRTKKVITGNHFFVHYVAYTLVVFSDFLSFT